MQDPLALEARDVAVLGQAQRQVAVGVALGVRRPGRRRGSSSASARSGGSPAAVALGRLGEVHVLAVVVVVAGAVPELDVEDLRRVDLDVAALVELRVDLARGSAAAGRFPAASQNGMPGASSRKMNRPSSGPRRRWSRARACSIRSRCAARSFFAEEGGPVDPGEHLAGLVAAPVGAGDRVELDRLDPPGRGRVRAAAEVGEGTVPVERDRLDALVARSGPRSARPCRAGPRRGSARSPRRRGMSVRSKASSAAMCSRIFASIASRSASETETPSGNSKS